MMSGNFRPNWSRQFHAMRRINRRIKGGMNRHEAERKERRLEHRLTRFIDFVHDRDFRYKMAERFGGGVDPR